MDLQALVDLCLSHRAMLEYRLEPNDTFMFKDTKGDTLQFERLAEMTVSQEHFFEKKFSIFSPLHTSEILHKAFSYIRHLELRQNSGGGSMP